MQLTVKDLVQGIGLLCTIIGLLITAAGGAMWLGALSEKVKTLQDTSVKGERIAKLEAEVVGLAKGNEELKTSVNDLVFLIRRKYGYDDERRNPNN